MTMSNRMEANDPPSDADSDSDSDDDPTRSAVEKYAFATATISVGIVALVSIAGPALGIEPSPYAMLGLRLLFWFSFGCWISGMYLRYRT